MDITGEHRLSAARETVWMALNDPDVLKACIPGCQALTKISATDLDATVLLQLGPVRSAFDVRIMLADLDPPTGYTLIGEGKSGPAGFGRGEARVELSEEPGVTVLRYTATLKVGGKLAQVGSRLLAGSTLKIADDFFTRFAAQLQPRVPPST